MQVPADFLKLPVAPTDRNELPLKPEKQDVNEFGFYGNPKGKPGIGIRCED